MAILVNHAVTERQAAEIHSLGCRDTLPLPSHFQSFWQRIPPDGPLPIAELDAICTWLDGQIDVGDIIWAQGEFGATFYVVAWGLQRGLRCVYATSHRRYREAIQGERVTRTHQFEHVQFRDYATQGAPK